MSLALVEVEKNTKSVTELNLSQSDDPSQKKDLTGIFDLPKMDHPKGETQSEETLFPENDRETQENLNPLEMEDFPITPLEDTESPAVLETTSFETSSESPFEPEPKLTEDDIFLTSPTTPVESPLAETSKATTTSPPPVTSSLTQTQTRHPPTRNLQARSLSQIQNIFSLHIQGNFSDLEKEKLLDYFERHDLGIRPIEIEPQIEAGRVLIPRISEATGIKLTHLLRGHQLKFKLLLAETSDQHLLHFGSESISHATNTQSSQNSQIQSLSAFKPQHPADAISISTEPFSSSGYTHLRPYDTLIATASLTAPTLEPAEAPEYEALIERLKTELRYKAYAKHIQAICHFKIELTPLLNPRQFKVTVTGVGLID
jgi:hypothetical protein